ncbi:MAG: fused MFS/spermidine synthase [Planctomycetaceae bacterium]|nr:fused MFS/spermidine synthase [Planctomycetaceae bacterium]
MWRVFAIFLVAVFLSGASALSLEILWQRQMFLVFGASAPATTAVLTAIFTGIAFGSLLATPLQRLVRHPLMAFAGIELVIGGWALLVPQILQAMDHVYVETAHHVGESGVVLDIVRFLLAVLCLLPATLGMGATIPVAVAVLARSRHLPVAVVYGVNTVGAVLGALLTGLILVRIVGVSDARFVVACGNVLAALLGLRAAWASAALHAPTNSLSSDISRQQAATPLKTEERDEVPAVAVSVSARQLSVLYFVAGYVALGLEVVWLRFLGIINTNSTVTFSLTLAVYLLAMGLGSLAVYPLLRRILRPNTILSLANFAVGLMALLTIPVIWDAPQINYERITLRAIAGTLRLEDIYRTEAILIASLMFLPALFMGLVYPAVCQSLNAGPEIRQRWIGRSYFAGTLGSVAGILTVAGILIPLAGLHATFAILVIMTLVISVVTWIPGRSGRTRAAIPAAAVLLSAWAISIPVQSRPVLREFMARREGDVWFEYSVANPDRKATEIRRFRAGMSGTVIIKKHIGSEEHLVYVDDQLVASTNMEARVDSLMLAHLPLLLHADPHSELTVGFGSGGTSHAITTHGIEAWCVEIEPEVPGAADLLKLQNFGILENPRFHLILNDARDHLGITTRSYDVIATDVTNLQYKQNSSLYTVEYFQLMRDRLNPDGIACAWIPMAAISTEELRILMHSFQEVFPHATLWYMNHTHTNFGILIGTPEPLSINYQRIQDGASQPMVAENLELIGITDPMQIIHSLMLDEEEYRSFCGEAALHTDNNPVLEFSSPLTFYQYNHTFRDNLDECLKHQQSQHRSLLKNLPPEMESTWAAHATASRKFSEAIVHFYGYLIRRGNNEEFQAIDVLRDAMKIASEGMNALPDDPSREQFYKSWFEQADSWLKSQQ